VWGVAFNEPTEEDIDAERGRWYIAGRCTGRGATLRESIDVTTAMTEFRVLVQAAGIAPPELIRVLESGDFGAIAALTERINTSRAMLRACLASIREASSNETQN
jgi:hypothetical protein